MIPPFEEFWILYPDYGPDKKYGAVWKGPKVTAEKAFKKISEKDHQKIFLSVQAYRKSCNLTESRVCHAATWLNQGRWKDDIEKESKTFSVDLTAHFDFIINHWLRTGTWLPAGGPDPTCQANKIPDSIMFKYAHMPEVLRAARRFEKINGFFPNWYIDESIPV